MQHRRQACIAAPGDRNWTPGSAACARRLFQGGKQTGPTQGPRAPNSEQDLLTCGPMHQADPHVNDRLRRDWSCQIQGQCECAGVPARQAEVGVEMCIWISELSDICIHFQANIDIHIRIRF